MAWQSKFGFNAPLAVLFVTAAAYCAWNATRSGDRTNPAWVGCWLGLALLTRHELPILAIPLGLWLYLESSNLAVFLRRVAAVAVGFLPAMVAWSAFNAYRFGNPLDAGYLRDPIPQFGSAMTTGLYGLLLSPTASLFVYCPIAIVAVGALLVLASRDRATAFLFGGSVLVLLFFYAQLGNWMGGRSVRPAISRAGHSAAGAGARGRQPLASDLVEVGSDAAARGQSRRADPRRRRGLRESVGGSRTRVRRAYA